MFKRDLSDITIDRLRRDKLFMQRLKPDIEKGTVFPAIRVGRVDFYHKGGKLFSYDRRFSTHKKYVSVIKSDNDYVSESDLEQKVEVIRNFLDGYEQIKENCSLYSGAEAEGVSRIYRKYPFTNSDSDIVILDIEISFRSKSEERSQDRIDILLFNKKTQQLRFYEAKHYSNPELWAGEGAKPRVVSLSPIIAIFFKVLAILLSPSYCHTLPLDSVINNGVILFSGSKRFKLSKSPFLLVNTWSAALRDFRFK